MTSLRHSHLARTLLALAFLATASSCDDDDPAAPTPVLTTITVSLTPAAVMTGQTATATAAGADQNGDPIATGAITWSTSAGAVATVDANGVVTGAAAGTAQVVATAGGKTGQSPLTVNAPATIIVNEVESNGGTPGDWIEFYNPTSAAVDLSGWVVKDNDDTHIYTLPQGTSIPANGYFVAEEAAMNYGLGAPDAARLFSPFGTLVATYSWTAHAATTYGRCPNVTGELTTTTTSTKGTANDCSVVNNVRINEVESNGGTPGDWVELYNPGPTAVNVGGFIFKDNDDSRTFAIPAGTTIPAGGYYLLEEAAFNFGLGQPDNARLFTPGGAPHDSYSWDTHATTTYGRCPDATGAFTTTTSATKGAANACPAGAAAWPGDDNVTTVDGVSVFQTNLSGLTYEGAAGGNPAVLWAVRNGPGTLYRLIFSGGIWTPDPANNWAAGKALKYTDGTGNPDSEGVTFAATNSGSGMYVATERNNDASATSRNSILRFDASQAGATLTATHDWNITADLPVVGANLGIEAITWVPDSYLTAQNFFDERLNHNYVPAEYPDHGTGLFFVGVEGNGIIYVYALNHANSTALRIATINTGFPGVMGLEFDRELNYLWVTCDDGCTNKSQTMEVDLVAASPTRGKFIVTRLFDKPSTMPNLNNEGFAIAPQVECVNNRKPVFWSDDAETGGHSIRRATLPCTRFQ